MNEQDYAERDRGAASVFLLSSPGVSPEDAERIAGYARRAGAEVRELCRSAPDRPRRCLYVTRLDSGLTWEDLRPVLEREDAGHWLIVVCGTGGRSDGARFSTLEHAWRMKLSGTPAAEDILPDDGNAQAAVEAWIRGARKDGGEERLCLLAAVRGRTGRSALRECLAPYGQAVGWRLEERLTTDGDYAERRDLAARVVFAGSCLGDFAVPAFADGARKSLFFLGKCDVQPEFYACVPESRRAVVAVLRLAGWDLAQAQEDRIFIGSALYSRLHAEWKSGAAPMEALLRRQEFAMWDEFLLPRLREDYTPETVGEFLGRCDCVPELARRLFGGGMA